MDKTLEDNILKFSQAFLEHLFANTDCFVRFLFLKGHKAVESYFRPNEIDSYDFENEILERALNGWNIHYGICGRRNESGKEDAVNLIPALWVDVDAKDFKNDMNAAFKTLLKLPMSTYIVNSGHGYQGIWVLKDKFEANDENIRRVKAILRGLAKATNGDAVHDLSRMLRLPGSINYKNKPVSCHMAFMSCAYQGGLHAEYTLDNFVQYSVDRTQDNTSLVTFSDKEIPPIDIATLRVSENIKKLITEPPDEGGRSEAVFAVVKSLFKNGYSPDEIKSVICSNRIGDRYNE
jgi:hypothetical protein